MTQFLGGGSGGGEEGDSSEEAEVTGDRNREKHSEGGGILRDQTVWATGGQ